MKNSNARDRESKFSLNVEKLVLFMNRTYIPNSVDLKKLILNEVHKKPYSGDPSYQKTITALKKEHYWPSMKFEMVEYLARCLEC